MLADRHHVFGPRVLNDSQETLWGRDDARLNEALGENSQRGVTFLPDGRRFLILKAVPPRPDEDRRLVLVQQPGTAVR